MTGNVIIAIDLIVMIKNTEVVAQRCSVKRCSYKFSEIYRKIPVLESLF